MNRLGQTKPAVFEKGYLQTYTLKLLGYEINYIRVIGRRMLKAFSICIWFLRCFQQSFGHTTTVLRSKTAKRDAQWTALSDLHTYHYYTLCKLCLWGYTVFTLSVRPFDVLVSSKYFQQTMMEFHQTLQTHCYPQDKYL